MAQPRPFKHRSALAGALVLALLAPCTVLAEEVSATEELLTAGVERPAWFGRQATTSADIEALVAVYERVDAPRHARLRALSALSASGQPRALAYLRGLVARAAHAPDADELHPARAAPVLLRALHGLRAAPGSIAPGALSACLAHTQPAVRAEAVALLHAQRSRAASQLLASHAAREHSPRVLRALRKAP